MDAVDNTLNLNDSVMMVVPLVWYTKLSTLGYTELFDKSGYGWYDMDGMLDWKFKQKIGRPPLGS